MPFFLAQLCYEVLAKLGGSVQESLLCSLSLTIQERAWLPVQEGKGSVHGHRLYQLGGLYGRGDKMARDQTWLALCIGVEVLAAVHSDVHLSSTLPPMYHSTKEIDELILLAQSFYDGHGLIFGRATFIGARLTDKLRLASFLGNCRLFMGGMRLLRLLIVASMV